MKIAVINGPNINLIGIKESHLYGDLRLDDLNSELEKFVKLSNLDVELDFFQSNLEGEIVDKIQECLGTVDGIVINPSAYAHTSMAICDALYMVGLPCVEVHISNVYKREVGRQKMLTAAASQAVISGMGTYSYQLGIMSVYQILLQRPSV